MKRRSPRPTRPRLLVLVLLAATSVLLGAEGGIVCGDGSGGDPPEPQPIRSPEVTLNAIPADENAVLVVPPSGFTVDIRYPDAGSFDPDTLWVVISPMDDVAARVDLTDAIVRSDPDGAVLVVPPETGFGSGSHAVVLSAVDIAGEAHNAALRFAIREPVVPAPLESHQWIQLDFDADRDGDTLPDFPEDLEAFGLGSAGGAGASAIVREWVIDEIVARVQEFYDLENPSQLPGGDRANVSFERDPPASGFFTRICVGGEDPTGGVMMGNVRYDPGNGNPGDDACDDFLPSGVFPREILFWSGQAAFAAAFDALLAEPVGTHALDDIVLGAAYDPGDPAQLARFDAIDRGVDAFAQVAATITAHEAGHALGLVAPGPPGGGFFGGSSGVHYTHNVTPEGTAPEESFLMNAGSTFDFASLGGDPALPLPPIRAMNWAYLRGRLLRDAAVDGIYPAPIVDSVQPATVPLSGPSWVDVTVSGSNFQGTPRLRLLGPLAYTLSSPTLVDANHVTGGIITFQVLEGTYDFELENGDGQKTVLEAAVTVVP
jgi:hypothetical protein